MDAKYCKIKLVIPGNDYRIWVGWSNANDALGFYKTNVVQASVFSVEELERDEDIKRYLKDKKYELVPITDISTIKRSRVYGEAFFDFN